MGFIPQNVPNVHNQTKYDALVWFIIGQPMSGKSTFANSFPNPLLINTDGNYFQFKTPTIFIDKGGVKTADAAGQEVVYDSWEYFKATISELLTQPNTQGYQTLILDLLEDLYEMCRQYIFKIHRKNHESEIGAFGQGYKVVEDEFMSVLKGAATLRQQGWNVIFLSHETIDTIKTIEERTVNTQYASAIRSKIENKVKGISHITGRTDIETREENTSNGPITIEDYVLRINEQHSIASNRLGFADDIKRIPLSYEGWRSLVDHVKGQEANNGTPQN